MIEVNDGEAEQFRHNQRNQAIELAKLHTVFVLDERARQLLALWKRTANQRVPCGASLDQYARAEAIRSFVSTIEDQIAIAQSPAAQVGRTSHLWQPVTRRKETHDRHDHGRSGGTRGPGRSLSPPTDRLGAH